MNKDEMNRRARSNRAYWVSRTLETLNEPCDCFNCNGPSGDLTPEEESIIEARQVNEEFRMEHRLRMNDLL